MDTEAFVRWAMDDARTVEERYPVELLVEQGMNWWHSRRKIYNQASLEDRMERKRQRALNPAYEPDYSVPDLRRAAEMFPEFKTWNFFGGHDERPIRDLTAFGFFTELEELQLYNNDAADVAPLARMSRLRVLHFGSANCPDLRPLGRCVQLRELNLSIGLSWWTVRTRWPDVTGLENLVQLEKLSLTGNLLAFARGIVWPRVRTATLKCEPLAARSLHELPQLPACEFLTLGGVETLDGIGQFPRLRNLKIETGVHDFAPVTALPQLTCFTCGAHEPLEVSPLTRLPRLQYALFDTRFKSKLNAIRPRDFSPFTDSPMLRELHVLGSEPVEAEVQTLNTLLLPWDDVLLAVQPRALPPLRMIIAPFEKHPQRNEIQLDPEDAGLPDEGLRLCEGRWVERFVTKKISATLGSADWGDVRADGTYRRFTVTVEAFAFVEKLPLILEAMRGAIARLRPDYRAMLMICLKSPLPEATPAQKKLEEQFSEEQDRADLERRQREQQEYLERLHRYELKKQLGGRINPDEFVPAPASPLPPPPWEREDETDDAGPDSGDVLVKEKPDPPPSWRDDEHPLAGNYRLLGHLDLAEIWFPSHQRDVAVYLMGRQPDEEISEEPRNKN